MKPKTIAVVGAAETTEMGRIPDLTPEMLHCDAALNAMKDAGLKPKDIDGVASAGVGPNMIAKMLGITPTYVDGTGVGGCSFMLHVRHAAAAINEGLCNTVLVTHGESGRSRVGAGGGGMGGMGGGASWPGQFEAPYGGMGPPTSFTVPWLRYAKTYGCTSEDLARVAVIQREWAGLNPRASYRDPLTMDDVLNAEMIAWPFTKLMCCLVTDGGGALILTSADRAKDFPQKPVYVLGTGESVETPMVSQMEDFTTSKAFRVSSKKAFDESGIKHSDVDHLMIYDAFAHLPLYGLEDLGFCKRGEAKDFIKDGHTKIGGSLPLNTNGGGLSYMHSGMYGMYIMQECVRQLRGVAPAQVKGAKISVAQGVGGMFAAAGTIIFGNEAP
jgi:acetyl-CoA acetyltransferase